jgi:hypothetical protein
MEKLNCWQFKNCGREKGGLLVELLGECPVPSALKYDGMNGGQGAGRACWLVDSGCICGRSANHPLPSDCQSCEFYRRVLFEEEQGICGAFHSVHA